MKANNSAKTYLILLTLFFVMMIPLATSAQLSQFESAVETEANSFKAIVATVMDVIFAIGAVGVIYAYVTKRQDARDYLIYYAIGIVVYGIIRQTYLTVA